MLSICIIVLNFIDYHFVFVPGWVIEEVVSPRGVDLQGNPATVQDDENDFVPGGQHGLSLGSLGQLGHQSRVGPQVLLWCLALPRTLAVQTGLNEKRLRI